MRISLFPINANLNPTTVNSAFDYYILRHLSLTLTDLDSKGQLVGSLAESWKISDDFTRYEFEIAHRNFSNGEAISEADVVRNLLRVKNHGKSSHFDGTTIASVISKYRKVIVPLNSSNE